MRVKTKPFFIIVGILLSIIIGLSIYTFSNNKQINNTINQYKVEILEKEKEIEELVKEKDNISNELYTTNQNLKNKEDELNTCKADLVKKN